MDSRGIAVIHYRDVLRELADQVDLFDSKRSTAGGHHIGDSELMHGQHVEISLHQYAPVPARDLALGEIYSVKSCLLVIYLSLGRIDILADIPLLVVGAQGAAAEADDSPADSMNREHGPLPEFVRQRTVILLDAYSRSDQIFRLVAILNGLFAKCGPLHRRPAQTVFLNGGVFQSAALEICVSKVSALLGSQAFLKEFLRVIQDEHQALSSLSRGNLLGCLLLLPDLDAVFLRQIFQCLDIAHRLVLHHETDSRACLSTAEAMIDSLGG